MRLRARWSTSSSKARPRPRCAEPRRPQSLPDGGVLGLFGPTASGKTAVAELLAERLDGEVVSADSMQAYRGLPILTAQPTQPTRLVGIWPLTFEGSVGEYAQLAHAAVDELLTTGRTPIVAGGTGLYLRAALVELGLPPAPAEAQRARWERLYDRLGPRASHRLLLERDPAAGSRLHANDRRRVVRALELTELGASLRPQTDRLWSQEMRHPTLLIGLDVPRDELERRIERRAEEMFAAGVVEEVRSALAAGVSRTSAQALGLRELADLPHDQALEAVILRTKRYASYQRKWMRRLPGAVIVNGDRPPGEIADEIIEVERARERLPAGRAG